MKSFSITKGGLGLGGTGIYKAIHRKSYLDPAVASGPLITTLNDGLSLRLYFGITTFSL